MVNPSSVGPTLKIPRAASRWGILTFLLAGSATQISSESYILTTYYPAPSGVYTRMVTTGQTFLTRDVSPGGGGGVAIGSKAQPAAMLDVNGGANIGGGLTVGVPGYVGVRPPPAGMIVNGNVGINNTAPAFALDVAGDLNATRVFNAVYSP